MAMHFVFCTVTEESDRPALREMLQQPQSKLLAVILNALVSFVDRTRLAQLFQVTTAIFRPSDLSGKNRVAQLFARPEIRHPDIVSILRHTASPPARHQEAQAILLSFDRCLDGLRSKHAGTLPCSHEEQRPLDIACHANNRVGCAPMNPPCQAVIFDLDGVLADSEPWWNEIDAAFLSEHGVNYRGEFHREVLGTSYRVTLEFYKKAFGISASTEEMMRRREEIALDFFANKIGLFPAVTDVLHALRQLQLPLAVGTSSVRACAGPFLERHGLTQFFDVIVTGDEVEHGKPHPDIYLRAAGKLGVTPEACLVIEDALSGIAAAKAAKMRVAAIPDLRFVDRRDYAGKADYVLRNLSEVPALVRSEHEKAIGHSRPLPR